LEVQVGGVVLGTYTIDYQPTLITTPAFALPAGEAVMRLKTDSMPARVVVERIDLIIDE
jgi:hypothetical protein